MGRKKARDLWGATDFHMKSYVLKSRVFRINYGLHRYSKFSVHALQPVLDLLKCLFSINNMSLLFTHLLLENANVFLRARMDFIVPFIASVIYLFV